MRVVAVRGVPMKCPDDVSGLEQCLEQRAVVPTDIRAVRAQTEGGGYARGGCLLALSDLLGPSLGLGRAGAAARIPLRMDSGSEPVVGHGVMTDTVDLPGALGAFRGVGVRGEDGPLTGGERGRVAAAARP